MYSGEDMDEEYDPANAKMSNEKYDSLSAKIDRFRSAMVPDLDVFSAKKKVISENFYTANMIKMSNIYIL